jgi:GNAT superfamily N-acetyltransferase
MIEIREADAGDVAGILAVYRAAGLERGEGFTVEEAQAQLASFRDYQSYRVFVALMEGEIAGTYTLLIMDNLAKRGRRSGVAEAVAVMPNRQGQGVGHAMMLHAMEQCRAAECYKLALSSNATRTGAHDFYEAIGFERHGYSFVVPLE